MNFIFYFRFNGNGFEDLTGELNDRHYGGALIHHNEELITFGGWSKFNQYTNS